MVSDASLNAAGCLVGSWKFVASQFMDHDGFRERDVRCAEPQLSLDYFGVFWLRCAEGGVLVPPTSDRNPCSCGGRAESETSLGSTRESSPALLWKASFPASEPKNSFYVLFHCLGC